MFGVVGHVVIPRSPFAAATVAGGVAVGLWLWGRRTRDNPRLMAIALGGFAGALCGIKVGFWLCEGPLPADDGEWLFRMATGKTILGGLLGGWIGVEIAKKWVGWVHPTGDEFALLVPVGVAIGRVGCLIHGCCQGRILEPGSVFYGLLERWPAPQVEILFQLVFLSTAQYCRSREWLRGQLFHAYLISYGVFRFGHEFWRDTPRYPGSAISPYMILAIVCALAGTVALVRRQLLNEGAPLVDRR